MSLETHQRVRQLFDEALARPAAERTTFLQAACGGNIEVFGQVTQLLSAHVKAAGFLETEPPRPQEGRGVLKDPRKARELYPRAGKMGYADARQPVASH